MLQHRQRSQFCLLAAEHRRRDVREQYMGVPELRPSRHGEADQHPRWTGSVCAPIGLPARQQHHIYRQRAVVPDGVSIPLCRKACVERQEESFLCKITRPTCFCRLQTDTQNQIPRFFQSTPDGKEYQTLALLFLQMLTTQAGLPGNDDSGAMGSFVAFSMLGLFPNPGQDVYLITPPFFEAVNITSPVTGKVARIRNVNFDPSYENIYIQRATLDGEAYRKNWIGHDFFTEGRELVLYLGRNETDWGRRDADLPPSLSLYE
jgi:hypothetical protein